ncbi:MULTISPECIES: hypothetical protein [Cyanophyceae]|uniref:hypothetical protein n=1 Tax=Cyanophyceae TaxID=3028117 RepID=UPI0018F00BFD|nr:hypothetical protein [Trichocoleus sp. FACHB-69]
MGAKLSISRAALVAVVLGTTLGGGFWAGQATTQREYQPRMRSALANLKEAKTHLEKASIDKGGHRAAALRLTNQAITEVNRGIEYDQQNPRR